MRSNKSPMRSSPGARRRGAPGLEGGEEIGFSGGSEAGLGGGIEAGLGGGIEAGLGGGIEPVLLTSGRASAPGGETGGSEEGASTVTSMAEAEVGPTSTAISSSSSRGVSRLCDTLATRGTGISASALREARNAGPAGAGGGAEVVRTPTDTTGAGTTDERAAAGGDEAAAGGDEAVTAPGRGTAAAAEGA